MPNTINIKNINKAGGPAPTTWTHGEKAPSSPTPELVDPASPSRGIPAEAERRTPTMSTFVASSAADRRRPGGGLGLRFSAPRACPIG